ncbi:DNA repair protein XRCC2 [Periophthalmus magnuspinnatus]|uniref:DNA repair protein XRCC2 n=1 Tax=Periophthalmus magnuspinnatus TaxID=409849 RepID=UPI0024364B49|nr:DNA repair protein XRCC2 [Periophthalmus magnuspinnatus]
MTETGAQLFARLEARRSLKDIEPRLFPDNGGPENGEVVEIFGPEGTGKTELLYLLLSRCILPLSAGGLELSVIFVDADFSLDLFRLVSILDNRLHTTAPSGGPDEALLRSCLSRLLVLHCSSSSQLLLTLHFLETSFASRPDQSLLLIDSISAFYWLDRAEGRTSYSKQEEKLNKCSELLGRLLRDYKITVFATCHSIRQNSSPVPSSAPSHSSAPSPSSAPSSSAPSPSLDQDKPYLCRAWQKLVSHRLTCSKSEIVPKMATTTASSLMGPKRRRATQFTVHCSSRNKGSRINHFTVTDRGVEFITELNQD